MRVLPGHVPAVVARLQPLAPVPPGNSLGMAVTLALRNQDALTNLLQRLYDPASPDYHHFLTPDQFTEKFGPTEEDYQRVIRSVKASGLAVSATHGSRMVLDLQGKVADVEKAFHVTLRTYQHPTESRQFFAPDADPSVDASLPIQAIGGLSDYARLRPTVHKKRADANGVSAFGTAPGGTYMGKDFSNAYIPGVTLTGRGQMVGLFEADAYYGINITNHEARAGLPNVPLINVPIDGFTGPPGDAVLEVSIDIEMAISMAPGLSAVVVFEAPPNDSFQWIDMLDSMASSNQIKQFSSSCGYSDGNTLAPLKTLTPTLQNASVVGGTFSFRWTALEGSLYQIQATAKLAPANWINIGGAITASNSTINFSQAIGTNAPQFYRVVLLP